MRAELREPKSLPDSAALVGAVLLAPVSLSAEGISKGTRINHALSIRLAEAARDGRLTTALRIGWIERGELHEDDAALRLARAVAGPGLSIGPPHQSRVDLSASTAGVLRVDVPALGLINRIDPLEVFTLFHGQAVRAGQVVAAAKVAPHIVAEATVLQAEQVTREAAPIVAIAPYLPLEVAAIAAETLPPEGLQRFDCAARMKVEGLGGRFVRTEAGLDDSAAGGPGGSSRHQLRRVLEALAHERRVALILVGGVSAGDPLSPFYEALASLGGRVLRRGVPAHPGSMIWLAELGEATILGLPQCGMFSKATAADLVLPRLLTGERVTPALLADLGHGGLLGPEMRFRFPEYARNLESPE